MIDELESLLPYGPDVLRSGVRAKPKSKPGPKPKTHCKHGHELTPENTRKKKGRRGRECLACKRALDKKWAAKRTADRVTGSALRERTLIVAWLRGNPDPVIANWLSAQVEAGDYRK